MATVECLVYIAAYRQQYCLLVVTTNNSVNKNEYTYKRGFQVRTLYPIVSVIQQLSSDGFEN